jgi:hypothetical protein
MSEARDQLIAAIALREQGGLLAVLENDLVRIV